MELIGPLLLYAFLNWLGLMIVIPIAGRLAGFGFPGFKEAAGKLAALVIVTLGVQFYLGPSIGLFGVVVLNLIIFWTAMVKWFDVDLFGAGVIVALNLVVSYALRFALAAAAMSA